MILTSYQSLFIGFSVISLIGFNVFQFIGFGVSLAVGFNGSTFTVELKVYLFKELQRLKEQEFL